VHAEPGRTGSVARTAPPARAETTESAAITAPGGPRLLLAEDSPINQQVALEMLRQLGYAADVAANGLEAVEAVSRIPYAAVLMDCQMPDMDGFAACAEIRRLEGTTRHTPIIAVTANAMQGDRERCLAAGMDDYIPKPFRIDDLQTTLRRWTAQAAAAPTVRLPDSDAVTLRDGPIDETVLVAQFPRAGALGEIIALFLEEAPQRLTALREAIERGDTRALQRAAHTLKGEASILGAVEVQALCIELEKQARREGKEALADVTPLVAQLDAALTRAQQALEAMEARCAS
jgi:two-component system sensor histidine kinase/response regulator